jgi:hypothetical protein
MSGTRATMLAVQHDWFANHMGFPRQDLRSALLALTTRHPSIEFVCNGSKRRVDLASADQSRCGRPTLRPSSRRISRTSLKATQLIRR